MINEGHVRFATPQHRATLRGSTFFFSLLVTRAHNGAVRNTSVAMRHRWTLAPLLSQ
jgi:hypothetical protein